MLSTNFCWFQCWLNLQYQLYMYYAIQNLKKNHNIYSLSTNLCILETVNFTKFPKKYVHWHYRISGDFCDVLIFTFSVITFPSQNIQYTKIISSTVFCVIQIKKHYIFSPFSQMFWHAEKTPDIRYINETIVHVLEN